MQNPSSTLVDLETKFWQSMVHHETDVALNLALRAGAHGQCARRDEIRSCGLPPDG